MLFTVDTEPLGVEYTSTRDREQDNHIQSILNAPNITSQEFEELNKRKKTGKTTTAENSRMAIHCETIWGC